MKTDQTFKKANIVKAWEEIVSFEILLIVTFMYLNSKVQNR